ncbi:MAG: succinylglutamate desuccinylase/aspartoacylase family protein [Proteobacteria bacterium]|nr:succinylglutamate desuccinylase/aspartoacylase family protein [Pseudomonadota bacterium]
MTPSFAERARPYPVELAAPDIGAYARGNTGVPYFTTLDSGRAGRHAMIVALAHGNEISGAVALDRLFREGVRPARGRITLGFLNPAAYALFDPESPLASRYVDEDFNRLWDTGVLESRRTSVEIARAREVRPLIAEADALLDLHSMQHPAEPMILCGPTEKGRSLARALGYPGLVVADAGHAAGRRLRDYGAFAMPESPQNALLVECGQHWQGRTAEVAFAAALTFLRHLGAIDAGPAERALPPGPRPDPRLVEVTDAVTVRSNDFRFVRPLRGLEVIGRAGTLIARDGPVEVRTPYDRCVLIMPSTRLLPGQTAVRLGRYVA